MNLEGNILVLTQWSYKDALVQTYTLPYVDIIRSVIEKERKLILITAEQSKIALSISEIEELNKSYGIRNMQLIALPYERFGFRKIIETARQLFKLYRVIKKEKIRIIHAFCTPAGGMAYLLCKITGAKLVIDSYEPHAESMVENGTWKKSDLAFKILMSLEKLQTRKANTLIATTEGMKGYAIKKYGAVSKNFFVKPACVDLNKFSSVEKDALLLKELKLENKIVCVYAGKLGGIYLSEEIFQFVRACYHHWGDDFRFLLLTNASNEEVSKEVERVRIPDKVVISKFVFHQEIPRYLSLADFAINPVKPVPTKRYCTSIKDGEYWAIGLPVIISSGISDDSTIIEKEKIGVVIDFSLKEDYKRAILRLEEMFIVKRELQKRIRNVAERYRSFEIAKRIYTQIYGLKEKLKGNLIILTQWSYKDALIQSATLPYLRIIREILPKQFRIILVTAEKKQIALTRNELFIINQEFSNQNISVYPLAYKKFGIKKFIVYIGHFLKLSRLIKKEDIKIIHAFCMPAGGIGYLLCKLTGRTLVMDSYEPHATAMVETGAWKKYSLSFSILFWLEKRLSRRAEYVIATTTRMKSYAKEKYGAALKNYYVKPACINLEQFYPRPKDKNLLEEYNLTGKLVCVYAGKLGGLYLKEEVFDLIKACYDRWGDRFRFLMFSDESANEIKGQMKRVNLPENIVMCRFVPYKEIPRYLSLGDFAINPQVPVPSKRFGTPIKNGEYWAMGLPVIISPGISDDSDIILENEIGIVSNLQQTNKMQLVVQQMEKLLASYEKEVLQKKIFDIAKKYRSFEIAHKIYPLIYGD